MQNWVEDITILRIYGSAIKLAKICTVSEFAQFRLIFFQE